MKYYVLVVHLIFHGCCCVHTRRSTNLLLASVIDLASPYSSSNSFFLSFSLFHLTSSNRLDVTVSVLDLDWSNSHDMLCGFAGTGIILQPQSWDECWHWENMMYCWQSCNMLLFAKINIKAWQWTEIHNFKIFGIISSITVIMF